MAIMSFILNTDLGVIEPEESQWHRRYNNKLLMLNWVHEKAAW